MSEYNLEKINYSKKFLCGKCPFQVSKSVPPKRCKATPEQVHFCLTQAIEIRFKTLNVSNGNYDRNNAIPKDINGFVINGISVSVEDIKRLFVNRYDVFSLQDKKYPDKFPDVKQPLTDEIILKHLFGEITIGVRSVEPKTELTKWVAWDIDNAENDNPKEVVTVMGKILNKDYGLNCYVEASGSKNSYHPWIFIEPVNYYDGSLEKWDQELKEKVESICKGDVLIDRGVQGVRNKEGTEKGEGCMLKLPFGIQLKNGTRSSFLNCKDLSKIKPQKLEV